MKRATVSLVVRHLLNREGSSVIDGPLYDWINAFSALLDDNGCGLEIRQEGTGWQKTLPGGELISAVPEQNPHAPFLPNLSQNLWEDTALVSLAIYAEPALVYPQAHPVSLTLGRSVPTRDLSTDTSTTANRWEWLSRIKLGLSTVNRVVANNTQFIQWVVSTWPGLDHKLHYLPDSFGSSASAAGGSLPAKGEPGAKLPRIIFSSPARPCFGISETLRTIDSLRRRYRELPFIFCGALPESLRSQMQFWFEQRSFCRLLSPEQAEYGYGDLALFPIKSGPVPVQAVLQAMQAGAAVIGSMQGPLVDMICHGYNGLLVKPVDTDLLKALERLIENPALRGKLADRARTTAVAFDRETWIEGWNILLNTLIGGEQDKRTGGDDAGL